MNAVARAQLAFQMLTLLQKYHPNIPVFPLFPQMLDKYSPPELLEAVCDHIMGNEMNAILYMSNTDYEGDHTSSGQYMLQVCNFLGVPVIAWNGDNSGFFQVSRKI